jgi:hypothetical protein
MDNKSQYYEIIYDLMSVVNNKLTFEEAKSIIFNQSEINNYPQLTEQEKISLLGELDNN